MRAGGGEEGSTVIEVELLLVWGWCTGDDTEV